MKTLTIGTVFSGIGGFELAFLQACEAAGIPARVAWMCEIETAAQKVLRERFPDAVLYDDIQTLDPTEVEPVDIYVGGSPCQGFSMAGARTGLDHIESRLFVDYVRVMDGLAARGLSYALWENVPGALSQKNEDGTHVFPQLIAALTLGLEAPLGDADVVAGRFRSDAKWNAGLAGDGRRAVSWRVLDSRHFGVPQRRRRVFACVAFGGAADRRAFEVLLEREGVRGDLAACGQEGPGPASGAADGVGDGRTVGALQGHHPRNDADSAGGGHLIPEPFAFDTAQITSELNRTRVGPGLPVSTLASGSQMHAAIPEVGARINLRLATRTDGSTGVGTPGTGIDEGDGSTCTVAGQVPPAVLLTMREGKPGGGKGPLLSEEQSLTLATGNGQVLFDPAIGFHFGSHPGAEIESATTLTTRNGDPGAVANSYGVRRLTPVECERLQGFPDAWTEPCGSDSARYRALGNAVTVNTIRWIMNRLVAVDNDDA